MYRGWHGVSRKDTNVSHAQVCWVVGDRQYTKGQELFGMERLSATLFMHRLGGVHCRSYVHRIQREDMRITEGKVVNGSLSGLQMAAGKVRVDWLADGASI